MVAFVGVADKWVLVDDEDEEFVSGLSLWIEKQYGGKFRVGCNHNGMVTSLHRLLMNAPKGMVVHHINGNPLDNRRCNLVVCTHAENIRASHHATQGKSSRFKGVSWEKKTGKWIASIRVEGRTRRLGAYDREVDAAEAYDRAAEEHFGDFAYLNFGRRRPGQNS